MNYLAKLRLEDRSIDLVVGTVHADGEVIDALSAQLHELLCLLVARRSIKAPENHESYPTPFF